MIISLRYSAACTGFVCRSAYLSSLPSWCGTPWRQAWKICATANSIWKTNRLTDKRTDSPSVRLLDGVLTQNRWSPGLYSCSRRDWPRWPVGAARLGSGISLPGLRGPGFRFSVVSYVFRVRVRIFVFVFYEPRLALLLNVRALLVTVYSTTVIAEHLREELKYHLHRWA